MIDGQAHSNSANIVTLLSQNGTSQARVELLEIGLAVVSNTIEETEETELSLHAELVFQAGGSSTCSYKILPYPT
ncbi:hypothetical protein [Effusibacillus lacus]|nr:hypothetical protein [Effusibacillus lacus]